MSKKELSGKKLPSKMAATVGFVAVLCSLVYHVSIFFVFMALKVYPMMYYNIFSISLFTLILFLIPHRKSLIVLFSISAAEVILHQVLGEIFIGSYAAFHFFIFMMSLLPYLVFDYNFKFSVPITLICVIVFIFLENYSFVPLYEINHTTLKIIRYANITAAIFMIISTVFLFTVLVSRTEKQLTKQNLVLENEIKRAAVIQQAFFKQDISDLEGWDISCYNRAMSGVSGDFFDFYKTGSQLDGFGIFDVSGHGISSGLITMLVKNIIHQEFYRYKKKELWEILTSINERIIAEKGDVENYLTGILARFGEKQVEMVIAGHPVPVLYKKSSGKCDYLKRSSDSTGAIGISGFPAYYASQFVDFEDGDRLFFYSDGITDAENTENERFGRERFLKCIMESVALSASTQIEFIKNTVTKFCGAKEQVDDISIICICKNANKVSFIQEDIYAGAEEVTLI